MIVAITFKSKVLYYVYITIHPLKMFLNTKTQALYPGTIHSAGLQVNLQVQLPSRNEIFTRKCLFKWP